jgi:N-acyl-L-homoserine lactone synthetase
MPEPRGTRGRRPIEATDELARLTLERALPVRFDTAQSDEERRAIYALRFEAVAGRGWADASSLPDGLEHDEYDAAATHIIARSGSELVGTTRYVLPVRERLLPTEAAFDLRLGSMSVVDHSRTVVRARYRDRGHLVFAGLLFSTWIGIRKQGYDRLCGTASSSIRRLSNRLGIVLDICGPGREYWGEVRYPYIWDPEQSYRELADRWGRMVGYQPE